MKYKVLFLLMLFGFCISYTCDGETAKLKSPTTAVFYSMGSTVLPSVPLMVCAPMGRVDGAMGPVCIGSCVTGIIVGPSVGHFYAGNYMRGFASIGLRAGIAGLGFLGVAETYSSDIGGAIICTVIGGVTCIAVLASGIYDIWTCPDAVQKYNESVRNHGGLYLTPDIDLSHKSYGIRLLYGF
jgi:hypothetical protein